MHLQVDIDDKIVQAGDPTKITGESPDRRPACPSTPLGRTRCCGRTRTGRRSGATGQPTEGVGVPKPPDKHVMERLAFIRYMYDLGVEQAAKPEPHSWTAVLTFHDAVELLLGLAASHLEADQRKDTTFGAYWKLIDEKLDNGRLPYSGKMGKLNDARVAFKHHGNPPSPSTIEQCRRDVDIFFNAAVPVVFGVEFSEIDLTAVISHSETARLLRAAQRHADTGDLPMAMAGLSLAFEALIEHYVERRSQSSYSMPIKNPLGNPLTFGNSLRERRVHRPTDREPSILTLNNVTANLQRAMRLVALGIDFTKFAAFELMTPHDSTTLGDAGRRSFYVSGRMRQYLTEEHFAFGRTFVIESALRAARADYLIQTQAEQLALQHEASNDLEKITWDE